MRQPRDDSAALNLVYTTFIERDTEWVDTTTDEILKASINVKCIPYPDGGAELNAVVNREPRRTSKAEILEFQALEHQTNLYGQEKALELAKERSEEKA